MTKEIIIKDNKNKNKTAEFKAGLIKLLKGIESKNIENKGIELYAA